MAVLSGVSHILAYFEPAGGSWVLPDVRAYERFLEEAFQSVTEQASVKRLPTPLYPRDWNLTTRHLTLTRPLFRVASQNRGISLARCHSFGPLERRRWPTIRATA